MKNTVKIVLLLAGVYSFPLFADVTLNFELTGPDMQSISKTFSISRFFVRVDDPAEPDSFLLFQAGKFFPLYLIDKSTATYSLLTPAVKPTLHAGGKPNSEISPTKTLKPTVQQSNIAQSAVGLEPSLPTNTLSNDEQLAENPAEETQNKTTSILRLTKNTKTIAGVHCRMVEEIIGNQPVMSHCMAHKSKLGMTERETRTLARLFGLARERNYDWLGTATTDEQFISIASQDLQTNKRLQLKSHNTRPLPANHLRVPREFKQVPKKE